ncbi:MAG: CpsD/CapB family tyrosine-protein kinase [Paracoccaceae bacterium]
MERLEAALEKAREKRREAGIDDKAILGPESRVATPKTAWADLPEIKITTRVARNNRITAVTSGPLSGPYDMLRSRALHSMGEHGWKRLAITSPTVACGKTTVAANLALSLARQQDLKIMLLDFDLRRPALHKVFAHRTPHSLSDVIEGRVAAADHLVRYGDNLIIGLNAKAARNPSELLQSHRTKEFLTTLEAAYRPDIMIFDMPPMLVSDDNVGFMSNVDCGLLIGAADSTTVTQLDLCEKELSELTNVLGVVLNKCRYSDSSTGYDYEYEYY